jgi:hypothetical protein
MLISINPFHPMESLYSIDIMYNYLNSSETLPPHIYQIVNNALISMKSKRKYETEVIKIELTTFITTVSREYFFILCWNFIFFEIFLCIIILML